MQACFSTAKVGAIAGTLIYFGTYFVDNVVRNQSVSESSKNAASILSTVAVSRGANTLGLFESAGFGIHSDDIMTPVQNYRFGMCLVMMTVSFFTFGILGLYLENVLP